MRTWSLFATSQDDFQGYQETKNWIAIIKAHVGSKIIASISVQEAEAITAQTASESESDFVEQSIGSFTSASSESSDLSDFSEGCSAVMEATTGLTKLHEPYGLVQFGVWKIYQCLFIPNCTRRIMWLLINNIHVKMRDG